MVEYNLPIMVIEQWYTGCLAQAAYYIESNGEAAVIDPLRETFPYMERAKADGTKIKYVFETHFHADFVSGHLDLARQSGAELVYGPGAKTGFDAYTAKDGEKFTVGDLTIEVLHTPGHTLESTTYLLRDAKGKPHCIFTGDTLFIGDVGRPDLAQKGLELTMEDLAGMLYDSLRNKIMPLPDDVIVYPAHGAGSACGKKMSNETSATLGDQKAFNYALRADMTREEFIQEVTDGLAPPPAYFPENVRLNKEGYDAFDSVMARGMKALDPATFAARMSDTPNVVVIDTREPEAFAESHVPGSIFIGLDGNFAPWVGSMFPDLSRPILLITDKDKEEEAVRRLSRVGFDHGIGFLAGGLAAWSAEGLPTNKVEEIDAPAFAAAWKTKPLATLDVRKPSEYGEGHVEGAINSPLEDMASQFPELDSDRTYHLHCKGGYRSLMAWSLLHQAGFRNLVNIRGGFDALQETTLPIVQPV